MSLSKRQLALRKDAIGGSEIACIAGLSKWASLAEIFEAKVMGAEKEQTVPMFFGTEWEEPIAKYHAQETGLWLKRVDTVKHPTLKYALGTPDRACFLQPVPALAKKKLLQRDELEAADHLLEVKSTSWRMAKEWGEPGTDEVPEYYLAQVVWAMGCTGKTRTDFRVLFDRDRCERYQVMFNAELFEALYTLAERFMVDHVLAGVPPPPDASEKYKDFLGRYFPRDVDDQAVVLATDAEVDLLLRFAKLKEASKRLEKLTDLAANQVRAAIGEKTGLGHARVGTVTWKKTKDSTKTNWQAVAQDALMIAQLKLNTQVPQTQQDQELLQQIKGLVAKHTQTVTGYRRLHCGWKNEAKIDVQQMNIALDKLEAKVAGEDAEAEEASTP